MRNSYLLGLLICSLALLLLLQPRLQCCSDGLVLGQVQRSLAVPVGRLHVGVPLHQQLHHFEVPCVAGQETTLTALVLNDTAVLSHPTTLDRNPAQYVQSK